MKKDATLETERLGSDTKSAPPKNKGEKGRKLWQKIKEHKFIYLMLLPVVVYFILFAYYPMYGIVIAVKQYRPSLGILNSPWSEPFFANFSQVFASPYFTRAIRNTIVISLLKIVFCFPAPIILALLMNELRLEKFKKGIQTVVYLPNFISWVIFGSIIYDIFGYDGIIDGIRTTLGFTTKSFMADSAWYYPILIFFTVLKDAGWGSIIYMAAISSVSPTLYEAAEIDGCGRFGMMFHVTLPCIAPIILIQFLLSVGNIMNAGFDAVFNTYQQQTYEVADILDTYVYRTAMKDGDFGMATAIGIFKSIINFALLLSANLIVKKFNGTGIYDLGD